VFFKVLLVEIQKRLEQKFFLDKKYSKIAFRNIYSTAKMKNIEKLRSIYVEWIIDCLLKHYYFVVIDSKASP
jgi:septum formation inhibitor-activating ATPase MinD